MSRRVIIADRIIIHERVAVPGLRPLRGGGDDGVEIDFHALILHQLGTRTNAAAC